MLSVRIASILLLLLLPTPLFAGELILTPSRGTYGVGDVLEVSVILDTESVAINAISGRIEYPESRLAYRSIKEASLIVDIWTVRPNVADGIISFEGIILNPGFAGRTEIITATFEVISTGVAEIKFLDGALLANDGKATNVLERFTNAIFEIPRTAVTSDPLESEPALTPEGTTSASLYIDEFYSPMTLYLEKYLVLAFILIILLLMMWYFVQQIQKRKHEREREHTKGDILQV